MKRLILLLPACFALVPVVSQSLPKNDTESFYINTPFTSTNGLRATYKNYLNQTLSFSVKDSIGRLVEEYYRYSDSTYLLIYYDHNQKQFSKGLLKISGEICSIDTLQTPDWIKDKSGGTLVDTIIVSYKYKKDSVWKEASLDGHIWKGSYKDGLREGEWKQGYPYTMPEMSLATSEAVIDNFRAENSRYLINGNEVSNINGKKLWPFLKGYWMLESLSDTSIFLLFKTDHPASSDLLFYTRNKIQIKLPSKKCNLQNFTKNYWSTWSQEDDYMFIDFCDRRRKFWILDVNGNRMTLKSVSEED
ncbi:MAG: hypothetical protein ABIX01_19250 [Chitinophagaceae bacterium]